MVVNIKIFFLLTVTVVAVIIFLEIRFKLSNELLRKSPIAGAIRATAVSSIPRDGKELLGVELRQFVLNLLALQHSLSASSRHFYALGHQFDIINDMLLSIKQQTVVKDKTNSNTKSARPTPKKQEVCPEKFVGKDLGYGAPYYRLGFARIDCKHFVPMHQLITLLMYAPKEFPKPSMSYLEMMQGVAKYYPGSRVILATSQAVQEAGAISKLNIIFKNEIITDSNEGKMWSSLLAQVQTPYVLVAPRITHFDDDVNLYRLVRVLSYRDDVAVAGGSYRNVTAQWDLGCRQASFNYWTAKYMSGYYQSFNECVVCDYLPGPFAAKTKVLKELDFDGSLVKDAVHDLFWRLKRLKSSGNVAVVCPDVMFNIDTPQTADVDYATFANKHEIKKLVEPDGRVRWYGCRRGLSYTKGRKCSWSDGMGAPPCDLWNLGEVIKFIMLSCEEIKLSCEYGAGNVLGAVKFASVIATEKDADIYFDAKGFDAFKGLRGKFEAAGFGFAADSRGLGEISISTTAFSLSLYGRKPLAVGDMVAQNNLSTRVPMAGAWVTAPRNPGLSARSRNARNRNARDYNVLDYFRRDGHHDGGDSFFKAGAFRKCPKPGHSACLDQYSADGNVQFLDYLP